MSFADRLSKRSPMVVSAVRPTESRQLSLCLPRLLMDKESPAGLVSLEMAPLLIGGLGSTRILDALDELLSEAAAPGAEAKALVGELQEAAVHIRQHLASVDAASELAHAEHELYHHHEKASH